MEHMLLIALIGLCMMMAGLQLNMARITLGSVINSISGSIDQLVYSTWKGINYIRSKAKTIDNPQSYDQMNIRARVAECAHWWYDHLTQGERDSWEAYAKDIITPSSGPGDIIKPGKGPYSGYNAFCRNNLLAFTAGVKALGAFIEQAPIGITPPTPPLSVAATWNHAGETVTVTWVEGSNPSARVRVWLRSVDAGIHAQEIASALSSALTLAVNEAKAAKGVSIALINLLGMYDFQMDSVDDNGQPSAPSVLVRSVKVS